MNKASAVNISDQNLNFKDKILGFFYKIYNFWILRIFYLFHLE